MKMYFEIPNLWVFINVIILIKTVSFYLLGQKKNILSIF